MKRRLFFIVFFGLLTLFLTPLLAQNNNPVITSFITSITSIDRTALQNRTARVPVSWATANRPIVANLIFEQVLPDR